MNFLRNLDIITKKNFSATEAAYEICANTVELQTVDCATITKNNFFGRKSIHTLHFPFSWVCYCLQLDGMYML